MVCGIGGWVDGGEAATGTVEYLQHKLSAKQFAEIPIDRFHVFQVPGQIASRPHIKIEDGVVREQSFPCNQFYYWVNPSEDSDLVLFLGTEPNLRWTEFADAILLLRDGKPLACGTPKEVLQPATLEAAYGVRFREFPSEDASRPWVLPTAQVDAMVS